MGSSTSNYSAMLLNIPYALILFDDCLISTLFSSSFHWLINESCWLKYEPKKQLEALYKTAIGFIAKMAGLYPK